HRYRVGERELVEFRELVFGVSLLEPNVDSRFGCIDPENPPDRSVEDALVVIVAQLDDAIALAKGPVPGANFSPNGIQQVLQLAIQIVGAERTAIHRSQNLDLARIADSKTPDDALLHQLLDSRDYVFGGVALKEEKVAL